MKRSVPLPGTSLWNDTALRSRVYDLYRAMRTRAKPKLWKNGRKAGMVRIPGLASLPFTKEALWAKLQAEIGPGGCPCPYCLAVGRPAQIITLVDVVLDHKVPLSAGGTWDLDNLVPVCRDCNTLKGQMSFDYFVLLVSWLVKIGERKDREYVLKCLRTHGVSIRMRGGFKPKGAGLAGVAKQQGLLEEAF